MKIKADGLDKQRTDLQTLNIGLMWV